jgi:translation initiation factor 4E
VIRSEKLKEILMLDENTLIEYKFHSNSIKDMSTFRNAKGYVFSAATAAN